MKYSVLNRMVDIGCQLFFGSIFFDAPVLRKMRDMYYRKRFNIQSGHLAFHVLFDVKDMKVMKERFIQCGENLYINQNTVIDITGGIEIGNNVLIAENVTILTHEHHIQKASNMNHEVTCDRLVIEDEVFVGTSSIILPSVRKIGRGAIISAGSVVSIKEIPENSIVVGNPARVAGKRELIHGSDETEE